MTLIVVSGAPGTGKSTVAAALAADLRWPLLALDTVKEALGDVLGLGGGDWSDRVGDAAAEIVFRLAAAFPDAVAEGWWRGRNASSPGRSRSSAAATRTRRCIGCGPGTAPAATRSTAT